MPTFIKTFNNNSSLEFDKGSFDGWCVYHILPDGKRYAPRDVQYFNRLLKIGRIYSNELIYSDFLTIYKKTTAKLNKTLLLDISLLAKKYGDHALDMDVVFTIIYAGMVAEENKEHAILKKRIKRLGMHQLLIEHYPPKSAATFSRGKSWKVLDLECENRGF